MAILNLITTAVLVIVLAAFMAPSTLSKENEKGGNKDSGHNHKRKPKTTVVHMDSPDEEYINHIDPKFKDFVDNCTNYMSIDCSMEIMGALFQKQHVTSSCCSDLVDMGLKCHTQLTKLFANTPEVKQNASSLIAEGHKVFEYCVNLDKKTHPHGHPKID